tara:strand:+ start:553 stop:1395 length:843 start_codon:yes stop_codon:yes gene_type:complete
MDYTKDLTFVLANTSNGYVLTTYKIGTIMIQSNATDFLQFMEYSHHEDKFNISDQQVNRPVKGKAKQVRDILKNEHITCLVRDPSQRTYTGIVQELLGYESIEYPGLENLSSSNKIINFFLNSYFFPFKEERRRKAWDLDETFRSIPESYVTAQYGVRDIISRWFEQETFRLELGMFFKEAIPIYWHQMCITAHISPWHYPLYNFIESGHIKNYSVKHLHELSYKHDNDGYRHSNKVFIPAVYDTFDYLMNEGRWSKFQDDYNMFIQKEWKYHNLLLGNK